MRSTLPCLHSFLGAASLVAAVSVAACGESRSLDDSSSAGDSPTAGSQEAGGGGFGAQDTPTAKSGVFRGNPLCHVASADACMPDDDGVHTTPGAKPCAVSDSDAGADAAGAPGSGAVQGCRLGRTTEATIVPQCVRATYGGGDGAACTTGEECAPGFDCVEADRGSFCRRYCCLGICDDGSSNGGATFCDVQKLRVTGTKAPVCMTLKPCKLLTAGQCAPSETCAIVNEGGEAGCVATGEAQVGQACDDAHCAVGLTCLGQPGNRRCRALCRVGDSSCGATQICKTTSAFKDSSYGICQAP